MGVHGLWRLIEPSGKPVPVESLENKVLAVDVSIWLHQAVKGFHDAKGAPALNAHLLGIFHRVCKLLYFKIKPVFVFDGGVPALKRETIAKRNKSKHKNISEADKLQKQLLSTLIKHTAVNKILGDKAKSAIASTSPTKVGKSKETEDLFKLPEGEFDCPETSSDEEEGEEEESSQTDSGSPTKHWNLHNIDTKSEHFKTLPADVRHEILTELKETRKQSSWGRLHELPTKSDDFSGFQMRRLLKRQEVQLALEEAAKEMGGHSLSLAELEEILKDQGVISQNSMGNRIASDESTRYLYIKDIKQALENARKNEEKKLIAEESNQKNRSENDNHEKERSTEKKQNKAELEFENDLQTAISLSLQDQPSSSGTYLNKKLSDYSFLDNFNDSDFESDDVSEDDADKTAPKTNLTSAQNYMMEYSGLNPNEIAKIISSNEGNKQAKRKFEKISSENKIGTKKIDDQKRLKIDDSIQVGKGEKPDQSSKQSDASNIQVQQTTNFVSDESDGDFEEVKEIEAKQPESIEDIPKTESDNVEISSKSEDSDDSFEEVENNSPPNVKDTKEDLMEIKIETEKFDEGDDLFADIFSPKTETKEIIEARNMEEKVDHTLEEIESDDEKILKSPEKIDVQKIPDKDIDRIEDKHDVELKIIEDVPKKLESDQKKLENNRPKLTEEDLRKLKNDLREEQAELRNEQGLRERLGANITDQMYKEAQELLELFGLPYVIAPMEAEAQCAYLETISLTDGTITDDSDIWLFGGKTVYKNFFNQTKHVLEYRAEDIKHHFKLSREQMILLALLVGSDYTIGLQGVGPVTALEILAAFPSSNTSSFTLSHNQLLMGLNEFRSWFANNKSVAKAKNSLRNKLKNLKFTESFPSVQVVQAYLDPTVDTSNEKFSWSKPDVVGLVDFGRSKFGWSQTKTDEILKPVLKRMKETRYQSTLLNYFKIKHNLTAEQAEKLMSERVKTAVKRIGKDPEDLDEEEPTTSSKQKKKSDSTEEQDGTKKKKRKKTAPKNENPLSDEESSKQKKKSDSTEEQDGTKKKKRKKTAPKNENPLSDEEFMEIDKIEKLLESVENEPVSENTKNRKKRKTNPQKGKKGLGSKVKDKAELSDEKKIEINECSEENKLASGKSEENIEKVKDTAEREEVKAKTVEEGDEVRSELVKNVDNKDLNLFKEIIKHQQGKLPNIPVKSEPKSRRKIGGKNIRKKKLEVSTSENLDDELKILKQTEAFSVKHVEEIKAEAEKLVEEELKKKKIIARNLHRKEVIPQRERDQKNLVRTRLRAIEVYRKSKIDPVSKRGGVHKLRNPKEDAELSEDSSDSDL